MSKREQLEEYFSQSLEVDTLLRLCPDDEDTLYQIVDLLVDTCRRSRAQPLYEAERRPHPICVEVPCREQQPDPKHETISARFSVQRTDHDAADLSKSNEP